MTKSITLPKIILISIVLFFLSVQRNCDSWSALQFSRFLPVFQLDFLLVLFGFSAFLAKCFLCLNSKLNYLRVCTDIWRRWALRIVRSPYSADCLIATSLFILLYFHFNFVFPTSLWAESLARVP